MSALVILVTGTSSGIGHACARQLRADGHIVFGTSRAATPPTSPWMTLRLDVTDQASVGEGVARVLAEHGRIDVLVNNAGLVLAGAVEDTSLEEARLTFDTNVLGALRLCKEVLPGMRARRSGLIVNIGSLAGRVALPFQGLYSASKFALAGLTEAMRYEVAAFGIRVVLVEPGDIATGVVENRVRAADCGENSAYSSRFVRALASYEKDERAGAPAEIVAKRVAAFVRDRNPPLRAPVGAFAQRALVGLRPFLPARLFEAGVARTYGLGGRPDSPPR